MKIAVYTSVFAGKDDLRAPLNYREDDTIDYVLFSESSLNVIAPYAFYKKPVTYSDMAKNARHFKILGDNLLKDYDYLIWHDANIQMDHSEISNLIKRSADNFLTTFTHPDRDDYYSEAMTCIRVGKDHSLRILKQSIVYFLNGMPAHYGMFSTGILIKNNQYDSKGLLEFWWRQTEKYSRRDQLSFAYSIFQTKSKITVLEDNIFNNKYSVYHAHNYTHYNEKQKVKLKNHPLLKRISFYIVKLLRKLKKMTQ